MRAAGLAPSQSDRFPNDFMPSSMSDSSGVDPVLVISPRTPDVFCMGIHAPSILWWFSAMGRPRRDMGILTETAHNLVAMAMRTLPKSVFPYDVVPLTRLDHITKEQAILDLRVGGDRDHATLIRFKNTTIVSQSFNMECMGKGRSKVLEDEMYMRGIYMLSEVLP